LADARRKGDMQGLSLSLVALADWVLELDRPEQAEAPARELADLLRVGGRWAAWPGLAFGPLAETVVRLATPDAEELLAAAEQEVAATEQHWARPQLLRARGLLLQRQGQLDAALEALAAGAEIARSQRAGIQLGRTLHTLAAVARQRGDVALAAQAEAELVHLIERTGPEVSALTWARGGAAGAGGRSARGSAQGRSAEAAANLVTPRERELAVLLARGPTNCQIAEALVIAEGLWCSDSLEMDRSTMSVAIDRIDHLVLTVHDLEATATFYSRVLGMEQITFGDGRRALRFGRQKLNLHQSGHEFEPKALHPTPGAIDVCFITAEPIEQVLAHVRACEVPIELGPVERIGASGPMDSIYFRDPDGNLVEVSSYWGPARERHEATATLQSGDAALRELFTRLNDAQMTQPATMGGGDWSAKDLLGHIAFWEELALEALQAWGAGRGLFGQGDWPGTDAANAQNQARTSQQSLAEVRQRAATAHTGILGALEGLTDEQWVAPAQRFNGETTTLGDLLGGILGGRAGHFRHAFDHLADLRAYVESRA
jgi:catechol 2,3-dioxygenase-like lactoylglutathione lyase family enzyme/DNA-binding NarL/FixJ family response regulator